MNFVTVVKSEKFIMNESKLQPKNLAKIRLARSKLMKIALQERDIIEEDKKPFLPLIKQSPYRKHDREVEPEKPNNPFCITKQDRVFGYPNIKRKVYKEPFIMSELKTICDVDSSFYKVIEGRPIRQFDDVKVYMRNIRDITLFKANSAYLKDQILQIDSNLTIELNEFNNIDRLYNITKNNFVGYAKQSYENAKRSQNLAADKAIEVEKTLEELETLSFNYVRIRNEVSNLSYTLDILARYRQFLLSLEPVSLQVQSSQDNVHNRIGILKMFENVDQPFKERESIEAYRRSMCIKIPKVELNFNKPEELMQIFEDIRTQCLNYMQINVISSSILTPVVSFRDYLKAQLSTDSDIARCVTLYKYHIEFMEEKEIEYRDRFFRLLNKEFQELYASFDTTKLFTCVQYVHNRVLLAPEDPRDSIVTLMQQLEDLYFKLSSSLDDLNQVMVKEVTNELFKEDLTMMNNAYNAKRTLRECDILRKAMYASFEPPRYKKKAVKKV